MKKMLLVVDPQIDFISGSLPVKGAAEAMDALAAYVKAHGDEYAVKIGIPTTTVLLPMRVGNGRATVCSILQVRLYGSRCW